MVKKFFKNIKAKCKGFSLMELVVTIAIMAVLAAVLTPALIHYVEDSRATKDNHAMTEVVNAMKVALAYDDVYDEVIDDIAWKNSCYVDSDNPKAENIEYLFVDDNEKAYKSYIYKDAERELDETPYKFAGRMYGATVTFRPNNENVIEIKDGVYSGNDVQGKKISEMSEENILYTKIKQVIGNKIELTSATYKNSQYTIFICFGVEGSKSQGESKVTLSDEPIVIYGQWSGTNLLTIEMQDPALDDTPDFDYGKHDGIIPEGGSFESIITFKDSCCPICGFNFEDPTCWCGNYHYSDGYDKCYDCGYDFIITKDPKNAWCYCGTYSKQDYLDSKNSESGSLGEGEAFPTVDSSDIYVYGDYTYVYNGCYYYNEPYNTSLDYQFTSNHSIGGWLVTVRDETQASSNTYCSYFKQQSSYSMPLTSIGGKPVVSMVNFLYGHDGSVIDEFNIPTSITSLNSIFYNTNYHSLQINKLNFGGTKAQWAQLLAKSDYFTECLDTSYTNVVHCVDGDVCVTHNFVATGTGEAIKYSSSHHKVDAICSKCDISGYTTASHTWGAERKYKDVKNSSTHQVLKPCTQCGYEYPSSENHTLTSEYRYEGHNNNYNHYKVQICSVCGGGKRTDVSHVYDENSIISREQYQSNHPEVARVHKLTRKCTICNETTTVDEIHSGVMCGSTGNCEFCGQQYTNEDHTWDSGCIYIDNDTHEWREFCDVCGEIFSSYESAHENPDGGSIGTMTTCGGGYVCYCGSTIMPTDSADSHIYRTVGCGTLTCQCGATTKQGTHHSIVGGTCSKCGMQVDELNISITQNDLYVNSKNFIVVGSWNFPDAKNVKITVQGALENNYDFIAIASGVGHSNGQGSRYYLSNTGTLSTSSVQIKTGSATSSYKFTGSSLNKNLTANMTSGTIFLYTDGSVLSSGVTIKVTPQY